ncbi:hypothetical protein BH23GEM6_BH23GEM6_26690 [soil metagenome]
MQARSVVVALVCVHILGCSWSESGPETPSGGSTDTIRTPLHAHLHGGSESLVAPDTVEAGQPFAVTFETSGNSCIEKGQPRVRSRHLRAVITAYDVEVETPPMTVCQDYERVFRHTVEVSLPEPGLSVLEVHGYGARMRPIVYSREIVVQ